MAFTASAIDLLTGSRRPLQPISAKRHSILGVKAILQSSRAGGLHRVSLGRRGGDPQPSEQLVLLKCQPSLYFSGTPDPPSL